MPKQGRITNDRPNSNQSSAGPRYKREADLRAAYEAADGQISEAAEEFDASYHTVRKYLIENGIHEPKSLEETSPTVLLDEELGPDDVRGSESARRKLGLEGGSA